MGEARKDALRVGFDPQMTQLVCDESILACVMKKRMVKTDTVGYIGGSGARQCCRASPYGKCRTIVFNRYSKTSHVVPDKVFSRTLACNYKRQGLLHSTLLIRMKVVLAVLLMQTSKSGPQHLRCTDSMFDRFRSPVEAAGNPTR